MYNMYYIIWLQKMFKVPKNTQGTIQATQLKVIASQSFSDTETEIIPTIGDQIEVYWPLKIPELFWIGHFLNKL